MPKKYFILTCLVLATFICLCNSKVYAVVGSDTPSAGNLGVTSVGATNPNTLPIEDKSKISTSTEPTDKVGDMEEAVGTTETVTEVSLPALTDTQKSILKGKLSDVQIAKIDELLVIVNKIRGRGIKLSARNQKIIDNITTYMTAQGNTGFSLKEQQDKLGQLAISNNDSMKRVLNFKLNVPLDETFDIDVFKAEVVRLKDEISQIKVSYNSIKTGLLEIISFL